MLLECYSAAYMAELEMAVRLTVFVNHKLARECIVILDAMVIVGVKRPEDLVGH